MFNHILSLPITLLVVGLFLLLFFGYCLNLHWRHVEKNREKLFQLKLFEQELKHEKVLLKQSLQYYKSAIYYLLQAEKKLKQFNIALQKAQEQKEDTVIFDAFNAYSMFHHEHYHKIFHIRQQQKQNEVLAADPMPTIALPQQIQKAREKVLEKMIDWYKNMSLKPEIQPSLSAILDWRQALSMDEDVLSEVMVVPPQTDSKLYQIHKFCKMIGSMLVEWVEYVFLGFGAVFVISALEGLTFTYIHVLPNLIAAVSLSTIAVVYEKKKENKTLSQFKKLLSHCQQENKINRQLIEEEKQYQANILLAYETNEKLKKEIVDSLSEVDVKEKVQHIAEHPLLRPILTPRF